MGNLRCVVRKGSVGFRLANFSLDHSHLPWNRKNCPVAVSDSGGADSTALLWALKMLQPKLKIRLVAAHLDHALDEGSAKRAALAAARAEEQALSGNCITP